jgi:hypothetical protein
MIPIDTNQMMMNREILTGDHLSALIHEARTQGIAITTEDLPQLLTAGVDTFLSRKGQSINEKRILGLYIILNELRGEKTIRRHEHQPN